MARRQTGLRMKKTRSKTIVVEINLEIRLLNRALSITTRQEVWPNNLLFLYKLLQINVRGNFYKVIKSLYSNSTCSIRIENSETQPFHYTRGVRQGCILSPILVNLYVNDLAFSFNNILSDPFVTKCHQTQFSSLC